MKVWIIASEMSPFASTGGLGEVVRGLSRALKGLGCEVCVIIPYYWTIRGYPMSRFMGDLWAKMGDRWLSFDVYLTQYEDRLPVYLIKREDLYFRPNLYRDSKEDYYDNMERFCFFCHACLEFLNRLENGKTIVHCNDWHTGLLCALIKAGHLRDSQRIKIVYTVHNIAYQGIYPSNKFYLTNLEPSKYFTKEALEFYGNINLMKAGLIYSDVITTVSPTHANELKHPYFARGLEGVFLKREDDLLGILNGVDYDIWNPATDPFIRANFDTKDLTGKLLCKEDLIAEFGLPHSRVERPLVGMVTRLDPQKGMDLVLASIPDMVGLDLSLVILGNGDQRYVEGLSHLKERYPLNIGFKVAHDERLAHKVIAGSDMILVPSLFEPCGLIQMYGLRYGTIPIGRATGGLKDTISPFSYTNPHGNGILFEHFDTNGLMWAIREGLRYYEDKEMWRRLILNGLGSDFSWERSAREYLELYIRLAKV